MEPWEIFCGDGGDVVYGGFFFIFGSCLALGLKRGKKREGEGRKGIWETYRMMGILPAFFLVVYSILLLFFCQGKAGIRFLQATQRGWGCLFWDISTCLGKRGPREGKGVFYVCWGFRGHMGYSRGVFLRAMYVRDGGEVMEF